MADFKIEDHSAAFLDELERRSRKVLRNIGKDAAEHAKTLAPRKTGKLAESITAEVKKDGLDLQLEVGAKNWKAHFFEFGTEKLKKREYIKPATKDLAEKFNAALVEEANKIKVD